MNNLDLLIPKIQPVIDRFAWATITSTDPLRIRLDGEDEPLDITPDCLIDVGWVDVARRVWVQISGRRVLILGQSGKDTYVAPEFPEIPAPYVLPDTGWINATLLNGRTNYGGDYGVMRYRRIGGVVHVEGMPTGGTLNSIICNLPAGFRPGQQLPRMCAVSSGAGRIDIKVNGDIFPVGHAAGTSWMSTSFDFVAGA